jgi:hypothetical protein
MALPSTVGTQARPEPLARVELLERYKDAVADALDGVPRDAIDLWSIYRDDALALSYFFDELRYDVSALDVGTFVGVSALLLASQPRVLHVTSVDPNPFVADELDDTGKAAGLAPTAGAAATPQIRVQDVAAAALRGFPREQEKIDLVQGVIAGSASPVVPVPDPSSHEALRLVAFVDGLHTTTAVSADIEAILAAQPNAIVILDDCRYFWGPFVQAGVARVLEASTTPLIFRLIADVSVALGTCTLGVLYPRELREEIEGAFDRAATRISHERGSLATAVSSLQPTVDRLERELDEARAAAAAAGDELAQIRSTKAWRMSERLGHLLQLFRRGGAD